MSVDSARAQDAAAIHALLQSCGLPTEDLDGVSGFLVAKNGAAFLGTIALEGAGDARLLRSLAVRSDARGKGVARALCDALLDQARSTGVKNVYLLTTDAQGFFRKLGFAYVSRETAPEAIRQTAQFRTLCPASAALMVREAPRGPTPP